MTQFALQKNTLLAEFLTSGISVGCANLVTLPLGVGLADTHLMGS
jgi:hypothetical protein